MAHNCAHNSAHRRHEERSIKPLPHNITEPETEQMRLRLLPVVKVAADITGGDAFGGKLKPGQRWRHLRQQPCLHLGGTRQFALQTAVMRFQVLAQHPVLALKFELLHSALQHTTKLIRLERFAQIVVGALAQRLDRDLLRAKGGSHNDGGIHPAPTHFFQCVQTADTGQGNIEKHNIGRCL
jgi:hypothetical protein